MSQTFFLVTLNKKTEFFFYLMPISFNVYVLDCEFEYYNWSPSQLNILLFCFASLSLLLLLLSVCLFLLLFVLFLYIWMMSIKDEPYKVTV